MGFKPYQNFLERLDSKEPQTKDKYLRDFNIYLQFLKIKDPNSTITKRFYSPQEIQKVEDKIVTYINHLKKQGLSQNTIKGRKGAIEFFYVANRLTLNWKHISGYIPARTRTREDKAYTHEDIRRMLNVVTGGRDRFLIYLLASTGMRIGALSELKVGDIEPMYPSGYQGKYVYKITVYRGSRQQYYCFCSFECADALDSYIAYRKRIGENVTPDSPLLRNPINSNLPWIKTLKKVKAVKSFVFPINRIAYKAGLRERTHNRQTQHPNMLDHAFRKFTISQMEQANVKYETREFLVGHKTSRGLDINYLRLSEKDRLVEYMKAVELLTISPENKLKKQLADSEMTVNVRLAQLRNENETLRKDMEGIRKGYQQTIKLLKNPKFGELVRKKYRSSK